LPDPSKAAGSTLKGGAGTKQASLNEVKLLYPPEQNNYQIIITTGSFHVKVFGKILSIKKALSIFDILGWTGNQRWFRFAT